jgi:hypothetical protein
MATGCGTTVAAMASEAPTGEGRDRWVDLLRAGSLAVVVLCHWVFTIIFWRADGPHASNPIGTTRGLWLLTWLLQVMPLFFVVGGSVHARALQRRPSARSFIAKRARSLAGGAAVLVALATWTYLLVDWIWTAPPWLKGSLVLVLSPLWFLAVYLLLILVAPMAWKAHLRWGELVPIFLAGLAAVVDVARFTWDIPYAEWLNWLVVFGAAHQTGFFWDRIQAAPRRFGWILLWIGLFALIGLTNMRFYPRSTVGVPGEPFSNLGPPTVVIVALTCFQVGLMRLIRDRALAATEAGTARRFADWITANAQPLYLGHAFAYAAVYVAVTELHRRPGTETDLGWWLWRPFWLVAPAIVFLVGFRIARAVVPAGRARGGGAPADDRGVPAVVEGQVSQGPARGHDT